MSAIWAYFKANWKSNAIAVIAFCYTVPQVYTAVMAWQAGQKPDWHGAISGLAVAALGFIVKDASTHSTPAQVAASGATVAGNPAAPAMVKDADVQAGK
jgi:hypothetical protein